MFQTKEQDKCQENSLNEMEISDIADKVQINSNKNAKIANINK